MRICQATFKVLGKENTYQQNFKSTFYHFFKEFISIFKTGNLKMNGFLMNRICKTRRCGYKILVKLSQATVHRCDTVLVINSLELCNVLVQVLLATSKAELVSIIQIFFFRVTSCFKTYDFSKLGNWLGSFFLSQSLLQKKQG